MDGRREKGEGRKGENSKGRREREPVPWLFVT